MIQQTTIFNSPIREFKTKKAAEKFAKTVIAETFVLKLEKSVFDMYWPSNKPVYAVILKGD